MVALSHVGAPLLHDDREIGHYTLGLANQGLREVRVSGKPLTSEAQLPRRPLLGNPAFKDSEDGQIAFSRNLHSHFCLICAS
jgi:hypothetical protein